MEEPGLQSELESRIGYTFQDKGLLQTALTHSSYANEQEGASVASNERLEFLGDAVTGLEIALMIFEMAPRLTEGQMTTARAALVRSASLAQIARSIGLGAYLRLGVGAGRGRVQEQDATLEDAFEALVGAVFLDSGGEAARRMIRGLFTETLAATIRGFGDENLLMDYKSRLQIVLQKNGYAYIQYVVQDESGPDHDKTFRVSVISDKGELGTGTGKTKKDAEKMAAKMALEGLRCI